jgi:formate dehydrogenase maturation protein FdhE
MNGKCAKCGKTKKLYYLSFDPDIQQVHRCKKCTEETKFEIMMAIYLPENMKSDL